MTKPKLLLALAALAIVALLSLNVTGQSETPTDAPAEPVAGMPQFVGELPKPQTILESQALRTGVLITKGYNRIGEIDGDDGSVIRITAVQIAPGEAEKFRGLLIQVHQSRGSARSAVSYVDEDELDLLIAAVQNLANLQPESNKLTDIDGSFRTRGDLEVVNINNNGARTAGVRSTQLLRPSGQMVWATASFRTTRLEQFQHQLEAGKQVLEGLKTPEK
jgi:hypothetical protein